MSRNAFIIAQEENPYHRKLELLSDKIVKLEQQKEETNIKIEYRLRQDYKSVLTIVHDLKKQLIIKDEIYTREKIKTEERLNKLEADNREMRKIIDELQKPSKYM
jgi:hypothetical protein